MKFQSSNYYFWHRSDFTTQSPLTYYIIWSKMQTIVKIEGQLLIKAMEVITSCWFYIHSEGSEICQRKLRWPISGILKKGTYVNTMLTYVRMHRYSVMSLTYIVLYCHYMVLSESFWYEKDFFSHNVALLLGKQSYINSNVYNNSSDNI